MVLTFQPCFQLENQNTDSVKHGLLINAGTQEALLDEVRRLQMVRKLLLLTFVYIFKTNKNLYHQLR